MILGGDPIKRNDVEVYLDDPKTCALYLSDALETSQVNEIAEALRDIGRANDCKVQSLNGGANMHLAELIDILDGAGIRLVAIPIQSAET
jgi:DNA-binding phage protein